MDDQTKSNEVDQQLPAQPGTIIQPGVTPTNLAPAVTPQENINNSEQIVTPQNSIINATPAQSATSYQPDTNIEDVVDSSSYVQASRPSAINIEENDGSIFWNAPEFIKHDKKLSWYLILTAATMVITAIIFLLTKDFITCIVIIICGIVLAVYGTRNPKMTEFHLDDQSFSIGEKTLSYADFRAFTIDDEASYSSFTILPMKRFALPANLYCEASNEEVIANFLSERIPYENHKLDLIDNFIKAIRF